MVCSKQIADWAKEMGIQIVNFTPGTGSNADYTTPDMKNYRSNQEIYDKILSMEAKEGPNGHLMLIHLGTSEQCTDKFYHQYLDKLIIKLKKTGYQFVPLREAVEM